MSRDLVREASRLLTQGELVAFPTETVYGLGADATNSSAVEKVFTLKGRPAHHPLIVHLPGSSALSEWAQAPDPRLLALADAFWPGPLTLVCSKLPGVPLAVTGGLPTVGLRVPDHPVATELLIEFGGAIAAPSANRFGRVSPTTAQAVRDELGVDLFILDGGATTVGVESTIITVEDAELVLLRHGGVPVEKISEVAGVVRDDTAGTARASGMLEHHYSPECRLVLKEAGEQLEFISNEMAVMGLASDLPADMPDIHFSMGSMDEYAQRLYSSMRAADATDVEALIVVLPDRTGLGSAIRDRLIRASTPRPQTL